MEDQTGLDGLLAKGSERAAEVAEAKVSEMKERMGLR